MRCPELPLHLNQLNQTSLQNPSQRRAFPFPSFFRQKEQLPDVLACKVRESAPQYVLILTDLADTQYRDFPKLRPPAEQGSGARAAGPRSGERRQDDAGKNACGAGAVRYPCTPAPGGSALDYGCTVFCT